MSRFSSTLAAISLTTLAISAFAPAHLRADIGHGHDSESIAPAANPVHEGGRTPPATAMPHDGDHGDHGDHDSHSHGMLSIPAGQPVPEVVIDVFPDPVGGWNLQVKTANWTFNPAAVNTDSSPTEGHAHLYINGEKVTRIYSEWYYIPSLPPGEHVLTVGLNANGHETLMHDGTPIEASTKVVVPAQTSEPM